MNRTRQASGLSTVVVFYLARAATSLADPLLPDQQPRLSRHAILRRDPRMLSRDYSLQGNGQVDYRMVRHIMRISIDDPALKNPTSRGIHCFTGMRPIAMDSGRWDRS